jgi:hypothetical protein
LIAIGISSLEWDGRSAFKSLQPPGQQFRNWPGVHVPVSLAGGFGTDVLVWHELTLLGTQVQFPNVSIIEPS